MLQVITVIIFFLISRAVYRVRIFRSPISAPYARYILHIISTFLPMVGYLDSQAPKCDK
ncbi:uncharacterized protein F4822DRAFT_406193 [Hypoxylon trugodes]|uniref:uncharacterized protein n=1 Tax=Hypoxylon trugodes TaxID=326681 RepID=UPI0021956AEA|nr:uncharacterized protein F4822DRAFT_406193 [Hypoxylon trugodes]KAI1387352.1 hypothetical protein F4822DRAFT_406193 [Hypoxylon trugodes]